MLKHLFLIHAYTLAKYQRLATSAPHSVVQSPSVVVAQEDQLELCIHEWVYVRSLTSTSALTMKQTSFCRLEANEAKLGTYYRLTFHLLNTQTSKHAPASCGHIAWAVCWGSVLAQSNLRYADSSLSLTPPRLHSLCLKSLSRVQPSTGAVLATQAT